MAILPSFVRFLASGAFNTLATYALYLVLLRWMPYAWSYSLSYMAGIVLAYGLYRWVVFREPGGRWAPLKVVAIYAFQFLAGLALVHAWVDNLRLPPSWAPLFAAVVVIPISYFLNRSVFRKSRAVD